MISDKDKNIIVNVQGSNLTVEFGQDMEADVIGKMSKETFDRIVQENYIPQGIYDWRYDSQR